MNRETRMAAPLASEPAVDVAARLPGDPKPLGCANEWQVAPVISVIKGASQAHCEQCYRRTVSSGCSKAADRDSVFQNHDGSLTRFVLPFLALMPPVACIALVIALPEVDDPLAVEEESALVSADTVGGSELDFCAWNDLAGPGAGIGVLLLRHRHWRRQQCSSDQGKDSVFHRRSHACQPFVSMLSTTESMTTGMSPER